MIKNLIVLLYIAIGLSSCESQPEHIVIAHKMMNEFSKRVYYSEGLVVFGTGGSMRGGINQLSLSFASNRKLDVDAARSLYIKTVLKLIDFVNNTPQAQPFLVNNPFGWANTDISLSFRERAGKHVTNNKIASIAFINEMIFYAVFDEQTGHLKTIHREPIEEALRIFYESENDLNVNKSF